MQQIVSKHQEILEKVKNFLDKNGFESRKSPGLLQPLFGYPFSPSAGHHVIDEIIISKKEEHLPILKFHVTPDRSLRMYDIDKIGISHRHLSFFETLVFGYAGSTEKLPKEVSAKILYDLMIDILKLDKSKLFITTFGSCETESAKLTEQEDEVFYSAWIKLLGKDQVARTKGRRNLFYSRVIGNPGGTGCEIFYKIGDTYVEIGSQVNYKFKFTGGLERTKNQAILEGFGFERLLMALENKTNICDTSLLSPLKDVIKQYLTSQNDNSISLFEETYNVIADHIRAISFIVYDGQELDNSAKGKILKNFIKNLHSQFAYLGINQEDEFKLINQLYDVLVQLFSSRYSNFEKNRKKVEDFLKKTE
ncbi:MAG: alanine--tRNA ligase-related protein [Patescibacteria group bacterium]|jgi:alanyl-tRNA synthetase